MERRFYRKGNDQNFNSKFYRGKRNNFYNNNGNNGVDLINKPPHYTFSSIEVMDVIEDWKLNYHLGNVVKYLARAGKKGSFIMDLRKACWYLTRYVEKYEKKGSPVVYEKFSFEDVIKEWRLGTDVAMAVRNIYEGNYDDSLKVLHELIDKLVYRRKERNPYVGKVQ